MTVVNGIERVAVSTRMPASLLTGALDTVLADVTPERYFRWRRARSGDPFEVRFPGLGRVLLTAHPDGARDLFRAPTDTFVTPLPNPIAPMVGDASLILVDGDRHRRDRALLMPPFHGQRMRARGTAASAARGRAGAGLRRRGSTTRPRPLGRSGSAVA